MAIAGGGGCEPYQTEGRNSSGNEQHNSALENAGAVILYHRHTGQISAQWQLREDELDG